MEKLTLNLKHNKSGEEIKGGVERHAWQKRRSVRQNVGERGRTATSNNQKGHTRKGCAPM